MDKKTHEDDEYKLFQTLAVGSAQSSHNAKPLAQIARGIEGQLVTSKFRLAGYFLILSLLGYLITLAICGQNGVGILGSQGRSEWVMAYIPHHWCAVVCGALFNGVPILVAFIFLNRFQRRYLLFRMSALLLLVPLLGCLGFWLLSRYADAATGHWNGSFLVIWTASAMITPYIIEVIAAVLLRQRTIGASLLDKG